MRIPVFARRANPAISRPILRKSLAYGEEQVRLGFASWVDPADYTKGIIALEMLPSGKTLKTIAIPISLLPPLEPNGCKFVPPPSAEPVDPIVRWMTAVIGRQKPRRLRMEAAAMRREALRTANSDCALAAAAV